MATVLTWDAKMGHMVLEKVKLVLKIFYLFWQLSQIIYFCVKSVF